MSERWERLFVWTWRINGLLLLGLGVVGLVGAFVVLFNIARFSSRDRPDQQLTRVAGTDLSAKDLRLADFRAIAGTNFLYAELGSPSEYIGSGSSGGMGRARNLLFFDTASKKAHWLFPGNDQTLPSFSFLFDPPDQRYEYDERRSGERRQLALAILVEIQQHAEGSEKSDRRSRTLAVASADGRNLTTVAESVDGLLGFHQTGKDSVLVFYVLDGAAKVIDVDPLTRTVRSNALLSSHE